MHTGELGWLSHFFSIQGDAMRPKKAQRLYQIVLLYPNNMTRTVHVRAVTREVAERRAMKRNRSAIGVKHA